MKAITIYQLGDGSFLACKAELPELEFLVPTEAPVSADNLIARQTLGARYSGVSDWDDSILAAVEEYFKKPLDNPA